MTNSRSKINSLHLSVHLFVMRFSAACKAIRNCLCAFHNYVSPTLCGDVIFVPTCIFRAELLVRFLD